MARIGSLILMAVYVIGFPNVVTAAFTASRISGPAPLGVFFDATASTRQGYSDIERLRFLGHYFHFGDSPASWSLTSKSKLIQVGGPLAYHVYETPGTYVARLRVRDPEGNWSDVAVQITVTDPNTVYAGQSTVCISRTTDHSGAPAGALLISNATNHPQFEHSKRYLYHAGQDFRSFNSGSVDIRAGSGGANNQGLTGAQLGRYAAGAKPIFDQISFDGSVNGGWPTNTAIFDLQCRQVFQVVQKMSLHILMLRTDVNLGGGNFDIDLWRYCGIVDCTIDPNYSSPGVSAMCMSGRLWESAIAGTYMHRAVEHNVRLFQYYKLLAAHNWTTGRALSDTATDQPRHCYKIHSAGTGDPIGGGDPITGDSSDRCSSLAQLSDCRLGSNNTNINWLGGAGPQNVEETEGVEKTIVENCACEHRPGGEWNEDWHAGGRNTIARGNTNVNSGGAAVIGPGPAPHMPPEWNVGYFLSDTPPAADPPAGI